MRKKVLIFSGYNQRAVIAFIRVLVHNDIPFVIIAKDENDSIYKTKYVNSIIFNRDSIALDIDLFRKYLAKVSKMFDSDKFIIAPTTEALNRFFLKNKHILENDKFKIPLVELELYNKISDKYNFTNLCKEHNIKVPQEYEKIRALPIVAKPKKYFSNNGRPLSPYLLYNEKEVEYFKKQEILKEFYFQEFIQGRSIYLLYYFFKDGTHISFSQENLIQQPDGKSIILAVNANFHKKYISNKFINLFNEINYFGPVMVELKYYNSEFYMIEANPRFWGPSQLFVDAKVPIFESFLKDNDLQIEINKGVSKSKIYYFWYGGIFQTLLHGGNIVYHNYSSDELTRDLPKILMSDVYRRPDTFEIFKEELRLETKKDA